MEEEAPVAEMVGSRPQWRRVEEEAPVAEVEEEASCRWKMEEEDSGG